MSVDRGRRRTLGALAAGAIVQARLVDNAPRRVTREDLSSIYRGALSYW